VATDLGQIVSRLTAFYDFAGRTVVGVGAGGGQLIEWASEAAHVVAVDPDRTAIERLEARLDSLGWRDRFTVLPDDFLDVRPRGDAVLFEFCLHLLPDPERALAHAATLAADLVVLDHAPGSQWTWCAAEETGVADAWQAVSRRSVRRSLDVKASQRFADFGELQSRLAAQGPQRAARIEGQRGREDISIDMPYRLALL
jgi:SAM-dependent methyltransferase